MKKILVNANQKEELRVAITDGKKLVDLDIDSFSSERKKGNIYKGTIARVEPGLDAVFVDYGEPKHGFLPFREISPDCLENNTPSEGKKDPASIAKSLRHGQSLLVQVQREGRDNKGAAMTTYISLAGRYLVLMPNSPRSGGVSRRVGDRDRSAMKQVISQLDTGNSSAGIIARTQGVGRDRESLQRDFDCLKKLWDSIIEAANHRTPPFLVYQESNIAICALRDHFSDDIEKILIDNEEIFHDARNFIEMVMPDQADKLNLYQEPVPLFDRFEIEDQIEAAFHRRVPLPSGGSLILDRTEALLSIDINSGKSTKAGNIEETALNTNLEAAEEIALQLRLRDLGGLIVIDFIDMESVANRRAVEEHLYKTTRTDQARIQFEKISRFGMLEMSRQRMRPSLSEANHTQCSHCDGKGVVRTLESNALAALRIMEKEAIRKDGDYVVAHLPIETASFLLNEKRDKINEIEVRHNIKLVVIPDAHIRTAGVQILKHRDGNRQSHKSLVEHKPTVPQRYLQGSGQESGKPTINFIDQTKKTNGKTGSSWLKKFVSLFRLGTTKETPPATRQNRKRGGRRRQRGARNNGGDKSGQMRTTPSRRSGQQQSGAQTPGTSSSNRRGGRNQRRNRQAQSSKHRLSSQGRETDAARHSERGGQQTPQKPADATDRKSSQLQTSPPGDADNRIREAAGKTYSRQNVQSPSGSPKIPGQDQAASSSEP